MAAYSSEDEECIIELSEDNSTDDETEESSEVSSEEDSVYFVSSDDEDDISSDDEDDTDRLMFKQNLCDRISRLFLSEERVKYLDSLGFQWEFTDDDMAYIYNKMIKHFRNVEH